MELPSIASDGRWTPVIKPHSLEKIRHHNLYAHVFATAMKNKWPQLAYIGLYSGAGHAHIGDDGPVVETTGIGALRENFTHYIFVDAEHECIDALKARAEPLQHDRPITFIHGDVNNHVDAVRAALPSFSRGRGLLSFCFVDPFSAGLTFATIRALASHRVDFLILLATGVDVRRNWRTYLADTHNSRIAELIDCPNWREEFKLSGERHPVRFVVKKFDEAMARLGFLLPRADDHHAVKTGAVLLYHLSFYTKHPLGQRIWKAVRESASPQTSLDLP